jgi:hypothetical protein
VRSAMAAAPATGAAAKPWGETDAAPQPAYACAAVRARKHDGVCVIPRAVYSVADTKHFPGAVALLNSLRLLGHDEPFFLVDAGLTPDERSQLAGHVTLVTPPDGTPPMFLTPYGPLEHPADVAIILDADIVITRPLTELVAAAEAGRMVAFVDPAPIDKRFFPEWAEELGLRSLRRRPYMAAGQLVMPAALAARLLPRWIDGQERIGLRRTRYGTATLADPFYFADMDVFNALLAANFSDDEVLVLEERLAPHPPFAGLRLEDTVGLVCRYDDGVRPFLLHHILAKPWLAATPTTIYSRLLTRLLLGADVRIRLEPKELPLRLREGRLAAADRTRAHVQAIVRSEARRQLGRFGIRTRLRAWRRRQKAAAS